MAKIFLAFAVGGGDNLKNHVLPPFYEAFISSLKMRGHNVVYFPHALFGAHEWGEINETVKNELTKFNPDLCILFNNSFWDISDVVACPIVIYTSDSVLYFANKSRIKLNPSRYFFITDNSSKKSLVENFCVKENQITSVVPFSSIRPQDMPLKQNIVFIGSKFGSEPVTPINFFLKEKPNRKQREEFVQALNYLRENPFADLAELINKKIITDELVAKYFNIPSLITQLSDEKRISVLSAVANLGLTLYGTPNWTEFQLYNSTLALSYSSEKIMSLSENSAAYNSSKIGISIGHLQAVDGFPWRILDIMQSNACLVTDYHRDFDKFFPKNLFPVYRNAHEAYRICRSLLKDENKRKRIVKRCQEFALENFSFDRVAMNVNNLIGFQIV